MLISRSLGLVLLIIALFAAQAVMQESPTATQSEAAADTQGETCSVKIELVDAETSAAMTGVIRVRDESGEPVEIANLLRRGWGVPEMVSIHDWYVITEPTTISLPKRKLKIQALHGLEWEFANADLDLQAKNEARLQLKMKRFYDAHQQGMQSANTHVHLQKIGREDSEKYLLDVARAEDLDIVYISYLERAEADLEYTTNKYTRNDLKKLTDRSRGHQHPHSHPHPHRHPQGTEFDNGQEHRHNFEGQGEGYGHVMLLHLPELVQPVSIGPGISKRGTDYPPLVRGIDNARAQGSTIIWCHNQWGLEDIPNWLAGKLQANNIFDGGSHGSYKHSFYRYLNAGLKVPFSTGTDWFIYDFSRAYVVVNRDDPDTAATKYLSSEQWLEHLAAGRSWITNGPLLEFTVNGKPLGDTVNLEEAGSVHIVGRAVGRIDFQRIEMVCNGAVVKNCASHPQENHFAAELDLDWKVTEPCWFALRTPPPSAPQDPEFQRPSPRNEYGRELFSHTSAIYVRIANQGVFNISAAQSLLDEMRASVKFISGRGLFADDSEKNQVLQVYEKGIEQLESRLAVATGDISRLIALLASPSQQIRDESAAKLREVYKPSPREKWSGIVAKIEPGQTKDQILARFKQADLEVKEELGIGTGQSHMETIRLDDSWVVQCWFQNEGNILDKISLAERMRHIWIAPADTFAGEWVTYFPNGQRSHKIDYRNGKYNGEFTAYRSSGTTVYVQHYVDNEAEGEDTGYHANGRVAYRAFYKSGKPVGTWTWFNEDGSVLHSEVKTE